MPESPPQIDVLTPPGRGAVAVISCTGDVAILDSSASSSPLCVARDGYPFANHAINRITFARWGAEHPEDVVVCRTSEHAFEIHCHGGRAAVERIRADLAGVIEDASTRKGSPIDERQRLLAAAWDAVSRATTLRTADLLLHQAEVAWPRALQASGRCEPAEGATFSADHPQADAPPSPEWRAQTLEWVEFGRHLTEPWTVALVGKPNAGKSSLMNALAGFQRSIVNPTPGTTRDAVTLDVAFDGWPVRLVDTAGLRDSTDELEAAGIERARGVIASADLVLHVFDATEPQPEFVEHAIPVANKIDLLPEFTWSARTATVSALTGAGIDQLIEAIVAHLIPHEPPRGLAIPIAPEHLTHLNPET
ncbi:tRNA modification GTPase MnmE [Caulifigura coniformis]|uniref:tRNA modification GTPase MnmE n=1 Tax=Caulifigura coniformis TaxID=2527983 RepID=A0A517SML0_9PLAN|nr:GTPase [Caulifigura coniformis]QDT57336.1 tRNA modification GTPase MnmE [Caulifigura coniformis]